jgi:hypothetical protein
MVAAGIDRRISSHLEEHSSSPAELKGYYSGSKGCKDQMLILKAIFEDSRKGRM